MASASAYALFRARRNRSRLSRISPICASDVASVGSSATAFRKCSSAASASAPCCRSTPASSRYRNGLSGELAIAVRIGPQRFVEPPVARRLPRPLRVCSAPAEPHHFDAPARARSATDRRPPPPRTPQRLGARGRAPAAPGRVRRAPPTSFRLRLRARVEARQRRLRILPRQLDVAERRLGRIERGRRLAAPRRTPARRSSNRRPAETPSRASSPRGRGVRERGGTDGRMKSGNFGAVTTVGTATTVLRRARRGRGRETTTERRSRELTRVTHAQNSSSPTPAQQPPRHVGDDRHAGRRASRAARPGRAGRARAIRSRSARSSGIERQRHAPDVERQRATRSSRSARRCPAASSAEMHSAAGSCSCSRRRSSGVSASHLL